MSIRLKKALIVWGAAVALLIVGVGYLYGVNSLLLDGIAEGDAEKVELAARLGASLEEGVWHQTAPLILSVEHAGPDVTMELLELGVDPDHVSRLGTTALHFAALRGSLEHLRVIANAAKNLNWEDEREGLSPVNYAISSRRGDAGERVRVLAAAGADPDGPADGVSPLFYAITLGEVDAVRALLEAGANPNGIRKNAREILIGAAILSDSGESLQLLLEHGLELSAEPDEYGNTDLHSLARHGKGGAEVIEVLLEAGFDPTLPSEYYDGKTPLELALEREELAGTELLKRLQEVTPR